jgi:hypothetical protein
VAAASPALGAGGWSEPFPLSNCGYEPTATLSRDGTARVVYGVVADCGTEGQATELLRQTHTIVGGWGSPFPVNETDLPPDGPAPKGSPTAVSTAGEKVVVWADGGAVMAVVASEDGAWSPVITLAKGRLLRSQPIPAINDAGDIAVAWVRGGTHGQSVEAAARIPAGRWSAARPISASGDPASVPAVALDPTGRATVAWITSRSSARGANHTVFASDHLRGGAHWRGPVKLARAPRISGPLIGVDGAGTSLLAWSRGDRLFALSREPGRAWPRPRPVAETEAAPTRMAVGPLGDVVIASGAAGNLRLTTRTPDGRWRSDMVDPNADPRAVMVNGAGDMLALSAGFPSNAQDPRYAYTREAAEDRPVITFFRVLRPRGPASAMRVRVTLSRPGRLLLTVTGAGGRVPLGAATVSVAKRTATIALPPRIRAAIARRGAYRLTADTGARRVAEGQAVVAILSSGR